MLKQTAINNFVLKLQSDAAYAAKVKEAAGKYVTTSSPFDYAELNSLVCESESNLFRSDNLGSVLRACTGTAATITSAPCVGTLITTTLGC